MSNKNTYESQDVVKSYSAQEDLQKPEETILNSLKNRLGNMRMLDIGVGGGRTTLHFAGLVKEYIGIDYSENMIKSCKMRFKNHPENMSFEVCDAKAVEIFKDDYFDFILFSFNGIDYISHEDRLKSLQEIKRVGKKGGFFCFSTHNLRSIDNLFAVRLSVNPAKMLYSIIQHLLLRFMNRGFKKLKDEQYAIIRDGAYRFRLATYYVKPEIAGKQLSDLGYKNIQVYSLASGQEISDKSKLETATDPWLYYLCNI
jgi:ubiquinone/menaquinone biosynthesis C-methylase UbiE